MVIRRIVSSVMFAFGAVLIFRSIMRWIANSRLNNKDNEKQDFDNE